MKKFIITVDTEGDNLWNSTITRTGLKEITTFNARSLFRFQKLCEQYQFIPTYLATYEMTNDRYFINLGREALRNNKCEIGMHMHAWNTPPLIMLPYNSRGNHPYIGEFEKKIQWEKMKYLTKFLEDTFQTNIKSFRSGRWYLDTFTLKCLKKLNYLVDCTITPGVSWDSDLGNSMYGIDYSRNKLNKMYELSSKNINKVGKSGIYEVPPTIMGKYEIRNFKIQKKYIWLRPNGDNLKEMLWIVEKNKRNKDVDYLEFMIHSSELAAGLNPNFRSKQSIEKLYSQLNILFFEISKDYQGFGLSEYVKEKSIIRGNKL